MAMECNKNSGELYVATIVFISSGPLPDPQTTGVPLRRSWAIVTPLITSAFDIARLPAGVTGALAPSTGPGA